MHLAFGRCSHPLLHFNGDIFTAERLFQSEGHQAFDVCAWVYSCGFFPARPKMNLMSQTVGFEVDEWMTAILSQIKMPGRTVSHAKLRNAERRLG